LIAAERARLRSGILILRNEDLDPDRCRPEFVTAIYEDLRWLGIHWTEGPDCGGSCASYSQSERQAYYLEAWKTLRDQRLIYPCTCSRKELAAVVSAPNDSDDEPIYPGTCRNRHDAGEYEMPRGVNWRFRVPDGEAVTFTDLRQGCQTYTAGRDFGDFVVWRRDDVPAYQLAVTVDDALMKITEVVRGADLLKSTARQILVFRALGYRMPDYYHCDLVRDASGHRMAKRHDSASIRALRESGLSPEQILQEAERLTQ
jgi:glutamyl/glutaminyl-tRNA synthetase